MSHERRVPGRPRCVDVAEGARIELDRAYVHGLREGGVTDDPRIGPSAKRGWEWVADVHAWQVARLVPTSEPTLMRD